MTDRKAERRLQDALDALPRELLPQRDLWPGIEHALLLPERRPVAWYRHAALAASLLLVLASSLYFGMQQSAQRLPNSVVEQFLATLQDEHDMNMQMLLIRYEDQQPYYEGWERQLQQLEQAEAAILEALRDDPLNLEMIEILRGVQQKQLNLIDKVFDPGAGTI
ncbi:MAG: hypothetical protein ACO1PZ_02155 [Gammaproteobacteria bacterium]